MRREKLMRSIVLLACTLNWGCSLDAGIYSFKSAPEIFAKPSTNEMTPLSNQSSITSQDYEVQSSINYYVAKPETITSQGYTVQSSVQATIFRD